MLIASLFVCALYMLWVLGLAELSVAMPFAGGPLAYGRRAVGPWLGFVMGWSMFLEALFATIGTALATGGYIYFILDLLSPGIDRSITTTVAGLGTVLVFAYIQWLGAGTQAKINEWMTYGAIVVLSLVLDRLHARRAARSDLHHTAADQRLDRRDAGDPVRHLVAGDDRDSSPRA